MVRRLVGDVSMENKVSRIYLLAEQTSSSGVSAKVVPRAGI